ncbi:DUF2332 domain-containing protein [Devosia sp.]|uniref:DUF2332 domain-containing protein n=1 Tax=Devosia sp. TaxID=1871048 RepID=UPI002F0036D3
MPGPVAKHFERQAQACEELGSPFTAALCRLLVERLDRSTAFGRRILDWPGDPAADALALRACGALHALARSGREPDLASVYPPAPFAREGVWAAIAGAMARHDAFLSGWLDSPPQTNEVARSSFVLGAALTVAQRTGLPLAVFEIGASAGLNLAFDQYRYELGGGRAWGDAGAPLTIESEWRGVLPALASPLRIVSRAGCDRKPLDPASQEDAARLLSYVWPDQSARLQRLEAALRLAAAAGRRVEQADAAAWVERQLAAPATPGVCRFFFHTIVWQYLPDAVKTRIEAALAAAGAAATPATPLARFGFEIDGGAPGGGMVLTLWPGGEPEALGRADYHGRWVEWG